MKEMKNTYLELEKELKKIDFFFDEESQILKQNVLNYALDESEDGTNLAQLLDLLFGNAILKKIYFKNINGNNIFLREKFIKTVAHKEFLPSSYTSYLDYIGLSYNGELLKKSKKVVLDFPYKDCILQGGQTKDEQKLKEVFYNEILANDEIDRLLNPKAFKNVVKYTKDKTSDSIVEETSIEFTNEDNLLIKGNNLLALHSLVERYEGKIKCIYIDPPYNTGSDSFQYNDNFNHSSWLIFMKNRLEIARKLLSEDGCIFIQCDHHELGYLNLILDEIFGINNKAQLITVKTSAPSGFKAVNPGPIDVSEYIFFYTKNKSKFDFKLGYTEAPYNRNYNIYLKRDSNNPDDIKKWSFHPIKEYVLKENGFNDEVEAKALFKEFYKDVISSMIADFAYKNAENVVSIRDLHKPTEEMKRLQTLSRQNRSKIYFYEAQSGKKTYFYNGGPLAFYSNKMQVLDGKPIITELLTNFWQHISWAGIANEGNVKLKNGKKPEKLLKEIISLVTNERDIVLDYHLGCGTTAAVAHKLNRRWIGIEQMDYGENDSTMRLKNVLSGDESGISRTVSWKGGGSFVYTELAEENSKYIPLVDNAQTNEMLIELKNEILKNAVIRYEVEDEKIIQNGAFSELSLSEKKVVLKKILDKNNLYINYSEINDSRYSFSEEEKVFNKSFYEAK